MDKAASQHQTEMAILDRKVDEAIDIFNAELVRDPDSQSMKQGKVDALKAAQGVREKSAAKFEERQSELEPQIKAQEARLSDIRKQLDAMP